MKLIKIYTDGACSGNPGPGGSAAILQYKHPKEGLVEKEVVKFSKDTTNQRCEVEAAIIALRAIKQPCNIILTSDSTYLIKGITEWSKNWIKNGWKNAKKKPVENKDLWVELVELVKNHSIEWKWVKGHAGHELNERADALARKAIKKNVRYI